MLPSLYLSSESLFRVSNLVFVIIVCWYCTFPPCFRSK